MRIVRTFDEYRKEAPVEHERAEIASMKGIRRSATCALLFLAFLFTDVHPYPHPLPGRNPGSSSANVYDIRSFGAKGDGRTLNTTAIQSALDTALGRGGGVVLIPGGEFLTGSIHLRSNVTLHLAKNATLLGSSRRVDYEARDFTALIIARGAENVAITGNGTIDGQGRQLVEDILRMLNEGSLKDPYYPRESSRPYESNRPYLVQFDNCRKVFMRGVTLKDGSCWINTFRECDGLVIDSLSVQSTAFWNNDGIDITDCRNVRVTNCIINSSDDGICLKSDSKEKLCDSIFIDNCRIRSSANALKLGTASQGGFKNIVAKNLFVYDTYRSAIALECVDGGILENIEISNVEAKNTGNAIFVRLGHRNRDRGAGQVRKIIIRNVNVEVPAGKPDAGYETSGPPVKEPHNLLPSSIVGLPSHRIQDVVLENIDLTIAGGAVRERARVSLDSLESVPERPGDYPEFSMFGELPAWGFYIRHVEGLQMKRVTLRLTASDFRPSLVFDDVARVALDTIALSPSQGAPPIVFHAVHQASLKNVSVPGYGSEVVRIQGGSSAIDGLGKRGGDTRK